MKEANIQYAMLSTLIPNSLEHLEVSQCTSKNNIQRKKCI